MYNVYKKVHGIVRHKIKIVLKVTILSTYRVWRENLYTPIIYFVNSCCMNTTETCNTAIEREFCGLSEDYFENCEKLSYEA